MNRRLLIIVLFILAFVGLLLHYRIHPFVIADKLTPEVKIFDPTKFLSFMFPLLDLIVVTILFLSKKTAVYGYLLNGIIVIYGTIFMAHYSIAEMFAKSIPLEHILLKSTLPDIAIAWADFFVGKVLYELYMREK
uniref:Uncharacterized protein n=1 Tax=candidate division WOR-3 bacterium TaxID=2052148 RepID=A0A7V3KNL4_UNCW3